MIERNETYIDSIHCPVKCKQTSKHCPKQCDAGFVCNTEGTASQFKPCPPGHMCGPGTNRDIDGNCDGSPNDKCGFPNAISYESAAIGDYTNPGITCKSDPNGLSISCVDSNTSSAYDKKIVHPRRCRPGVYCLEQVSTNETEGQVGVGITRPQKCTEGYFCKEKSNTPQGKDGKGICPKGNYCPVGSALPIQASTGHFVGTEGRSFKERCPSGKYADETGLECVRLLASLN